MTIGRAVGMVPSERHLCLHHRNVYLFIVVALGHDVIDLFLLLRVPLAIEQINKNHCLILANFAEMPTLICY